jgi:hypothetical protein
LICLCLAEIEFHTTSILAKGETLMPATPEARARTRAFARVIGPFLVIVPAIMVVRAPSMATNLSAFFENAALVWITGGMMLLGGVADYRAPPILVEPRVRSSSLFSWFVALRGVTLLAAPQLIERAVAAAMNMMPIVQFSFGPSSC